MPRPPRTPRNPDSVDRVKQLEKDVQTLRLRPQTAGATAVQTYQPTDAVVNNAGGWYIGAVGGAPCPWWVRHGDMISMGGCWQFYDAGSNSLTLMTAGVLPAAFRPFTSIGVHALGVGATQDRIWHLFLLPDGLLSLTSMANGPLPGTPGGPLESWGSIVDGDDHSISIIPFTYPAAELGIA